MKAFYLATILIFTTGVFAAEELEAIQVMDHRDDQGLVDFIPSVSTLEGDELSKRLHTTLGDTLQNEAGVNSTSFGPNASRPVIRGLDGARIRVLQNSLGTLDASTQSVDHAIPLETLLIDQVEVVRGPMSLLYGSSAVGGVVNIVTNRIHRNYEEGFLAEFMTQAETVNDGLSNSARMDYGKNRWMFHLDGSTRNLQDQDIPQDETLQNSHNKQDSIGAGTTHFFDQGHLGVSFNHLINDYGTVVEEDVTIQMLQNRFELSGEWNLKRTPFKTIRLRSAQSDYRHKEMEGEETGTVFSNEGNETRVELINRANKINGVTGVQTQLFSFKAEGEEAFLPGTKNRILALFSFQEYSTGSHAISVGGRIEDTLIEGPDDFGFTGLNGSLGYLYKLDANSSAGANYSFTERAPTFQELLSEGEHVATGTFDQGSTGLDKEEAHSFELTFKHKNERSMLNFSLYTQIFSDYIAFAPTGIIDGGSGFEIYQYEQVDATFYGMDLEWNNRLTRAYGGDINFFSTADFVRAKNDDGENLPRISPPRIHAGLEFVRDNFSSDFEFQHVLAQTKTAPGESRTDSYTLLNLGARYSIIKQRSKLDLFLRVRNLADEEARNHVSTIKEIAPLPGRNFILGAQLLI